MKLPAQWENLAAREKLILLLGSACFIAILTYTLIIQPFFSAVNDLQNQVQTKRDLISWLAPAAQKIQQYNNKGYTTLPPLSGSLTDKINNTLKTHQLNNFITQLTPIDKDHVKISFNTVPFDAAMDWLTTFWLITDIKIQQATITPTATPGLVSMELIITSP